MSESEPLPEQDQNLLNIAIQKSEINPYKAGQEQEVNLTEKIVEQNLSDDERETQRSQFGVAFERKREILNFIKGGAEARASSEGKYELILTQEQKERAFEQFMGEEIFASVLNKISEDIIKDLVFEDEYEYVWGEEDKQGNTVKKYVGKRVVDSYFISGTGEYEKWKQNISIAIKAADNYLKDRIAFIKDPNENESEYVDSEWRDAVRTAKRKITLALAEKLFTVVNKKINGEKIGTGYLSDNEIADMYTIVGKTVGSVSTFDVGRNAGGVSWEVPGVYYKINMFEREKNIEIKPSVS